MTQPTNDQKRCTEEVSPLVGGADPGSATMLSRMFLQGADPLFIAKMAQNGVRLLAKFVGLTPHEVMVAIEGAHKMGPGIFESGEELGWNGELAHYEPHHAAEVAWLVLAAFSHENEHGYTEESAEERMVLAFRHVLAFNSWADSVERVEDPKASVLEFASHKLAEFREATHFEWDPDNYPESVPTTDVDIGFYIGYKKGFSAVAVKAPGMTFYGTASEHTLEEQGIVVDKMISPQFGIVFDKESDR